MLAVAVVVLAAPTAQANAWQDARPTDPDWTIAFSPYHLGYPMALFSFDYHLHDAGSITLELGAGSFRNADAFVLGVRAPFYVWGDYRFAFFLAPFFRAIAMQYGSEHSTAPPMVGSVHSVTEVVMFDIEHARANGSSALVPGLWGGARYVGPFGITLQGALGFCYAVPVARTSLGSDPDASSTGGQLWPMFLIELGMAF